MHLQKVQSGPCEKIITLLHKQIKNDSSQYRKNTITRHIEISLETGYSISEESNTISVIFK